MTPGTEDLTAQWGRRLDGLEGTFSLVLSDGDQTVAAREPDARHYPASTIKLAVLGALLRDGPLTTDDVVVVDSFEGRVGDFRLNPQQDQDDWTWRRLGYRVALADLAERMITVSSNIATNLLITHLGLSAVDDFLNVAGLGGDVVVKRMIGDSAAEAAGITNTVSARGLADLLAHLTTDERFPAVSRSTALDLLHRQTHLDMIPAGLPRGTWSASKGGWVPGVKHDVALVRPRHRRPYRLAVCTTSDLADLAGATLVADLSRITWRWWSQRIA